MAVAVAALVAVVSWSSSAVAQDAEPGSEQGGSWGSMPMASSGSDPRLERRLSRMGGGSRHSTGPVGSFFVGVPIANDVDRDLVRPGGSLDFRGGLDLGYVVPELEAGFMALPIKVSRLDPTLNDEPLKQIYFGLGLRLQIPNASPVLPYLSGAFDFQFWNLQERQVVCDWYCRETDDYDFAPGFTGRGGVAIKLTKRIALDVNLRVGMAFAGNVFRSSQSWLQPSLGMTFWK